MRILISTDIIYAPLNRKYFQNSLEDRGSEIDFVQKVPMCTEVKFLRTPWTAGERAHEKNIL